MRPPNSKNENTENMKTLETAKTETTEEKLQRIGEGAMSYIMDMVAALSLETAAPAFVATLTDEEVTAHLVSLYTENEDEDTLASLKGRGVENLRDTLTQEIEDGFEPDGFEFDEDAAREAIQEDPLSFQVRSGWYQPGSEDNEPEEFELLLSTGGPATRIIGDIDRGTSWGSGIEQQNRGFLIYTLRPYLANIAQAFVRDLMPEKDQAKYVMRFDTSDLERADFGPRQAGLAIMRQNGVINADEWRKIEGWNPRGDEAANDYLTPGANQGAGDGDRDRAGGNQAPDGQGSPDPAEDQRQAARRAPLAVVK
jgi:hypothetical protein